MAKKNFETSCSYFAGTVMHVSTDEQRMISRIMKLAKVNPGKVTILAEPKDNDGCLYCTVPANWLHLYTPPKGREQTQEQKDAARERLMQYRIRQNKLQM